MVTFFGKQFIARYLISSLLLCVCISLSTELLAEDQPPSISGFWSSASNPGTVVFVFGAHFNTAPGQTTVSVNGISTPLVQVANSDLLLFLLPAGNTNGPIVVTTPLGSAASDIDFGAILTGLQITGFWPPAVSPGAAVFVFGSGFLPGQTSVILGNVSANIFQVLDDGILIFFVPTNATSAPIQITTTSGSATSSQALTIIGTSSPSINSTSRNSLTLGTTVPEQPFVKLNDFQILVANDLGMHCADVDHRVASILPPFNVLHAQVIRKGLGLTKPDLLDDTQVKVVYSAASNPKDPALQLSPVGQSPIYKTNFWDLSAHTGTPVGFEAYDPFYPPGILSAFPFSIDLGLPVPNLEILYLGAGILTADQQAMPGINNAYNENSPQEFGRFDRDIPFFINFPFGYTITEMNWFAGDGIPIAAVDDQGRENAYPLMRVQAIDVNGSLTGTSGSVLASTDTVLPVAFETDCKNCHTSSTDGGNGEAACIPSFDVNCTVEGSRRSGTAFPVAVTFDDPDINSTEAQSEEYAADINILQLHDAKHGTNLIDGTTLDTPGGAMAFSAVACATCHYSPALDLAHVGPLGPNDPAANGREQTTHASMSNVMHSHHGQFTDLFPPMPPPAQGNQNARTLVLEQTCYQCHPGNKTQCLRGAMFKADILCQDCHGSMEQVGNDFTTNFPDTPFPAGADLSKRVPWASEPMCQSCHTGDVLNSEANQPNVITAQDGIRLLQAYLNNDSDAKPIVAINKRFAENTLNGQNVLYRLSKGHGGVFCEGCHGSTHAIWPVEPRTGPFVANDNMTAIQLQGHDGTIQECDACHERNSGGRLNLPLSLDGPHGMHMVNDPVWNNDHKEIVGSNRDACRACHGANGEGTVLSRVATDRHFQAKDTQSDGSKNIFFPAGTQVGCFECHSNEL